jgi:hypothetical protein
VPDSYIQSELYGSLPSKDPCPARVEIKMGTISTLCSVCMVMVRSRSWRYVNDSGCTDEWCSVSCSVTRNE